MNVEAFIRLSRNASAENRAALEIAGLHWNGRAGGWTGHVTSAASQQLRRVFGKRVIKPAAADPGGPDERNSTTDQEAVASCLDADVEAAAPLEPAAEQDLTKSSEPVEQLPVPAAGSVRTTLPPIRGFPTRRPGAI